MKKIALALIGISLISCSNKKATDKEIKTVETSDTVIKYIPPEIIKKEFLILPGNSIGLTQLGQNTEMLSVLGKPDFSDAAMGKAWSTWYSKDGEKNELNIYTAYKDSQMKEKVVRQIRVTSPEFKTSEGISTNSSLEEIQKLYPNLKLVGKYSSKNKQIQIYDSLDSGIAFEIENDKCVAIIIHEKNKNVTEEYITFHPDMDRF